MKQIVDTLVWVAVIAMTVGIGWLALLAGDINRQFWDSL